MLDPIHLQGHKQTFEKHMGESSKVKALSTTIGEREEGTTDKQDPSSEVIFEILAITYSKRTKYLLIIFRL